MQHLGEHDCEAEDRKVATCEVVDSESETGDAYNFLPELSYSFAKLPPSSWLLVKFASMNRSSCARGTGDINLSFVSVPNV